MKKTELDLKQKALRDAGSFKKASATPQRFNYPKDLNTTQSRLVVHQDVKPAQDAYAAAGYLAEQLRVQLARPDLDAKERAALARTLRDAVASLVALRQEGRATAAAMTNDELIAAVRLLLGEE